MRYTSALINPDFEPDRQGSEMKKTYIVVFALAALCLLILLFHTELTQFSQGFLAGLHKG